MNLVLSYGVATDNAKYLKMGPHNATSNKGRNRIVLEGQDFYVDENDASTETLNARYNYWSRNGIHHTVEDSVTVDYSTSTDSVGTVDIDASGILATDPFITNPCGTSSRTGLVSGPETALSESEPERSLGDAVRLSGVSVETTLRSPRPNPSSAATEIRFGISAEHAGDVDLSVYDVRGRLVKALLSGPSPPGLYAVSWRGQGSDGGRVAPGIYFVRLRAEGYQSTRKLVMVR